VRSFRGAPAHAFAEVRLAGLQDRGCSASAVRLALAALRPDRPTTLLGDFGKLAALQSHLLIGLACQAAAVPIGHGLEDACLLRLEAAARTWRTRKTARQASLELGLTALPGALHAHAQIAPNATQAFESVTRADLGGATRYEQQAAENYGHDDARQGWLSSQVTTVACPSVTLTSWVLLPSVSCQTSTS